MTVIKSTSLKRGGKKKKKKTHQVNTTAILWTLAAGTVRVLRTCAH